MTSKLVLIRRAQWTSGALAVAAIASAIWIYLSLPVVNSSRSLQTRALDVTLRGNDLIIANLWPTALRCAITYGYVGGPTNVFGYRYMADGEGAGYQLPLGPFSRVSVTILPQGYVLSGFKIDAAGRAPYVLPGARRSNSPADFYVVSYSQTNRRWHTSIVPSPHLDWAQKQARVAELIALILALVSGCVFGRLVWSKQLRSQSAVHIRSASLPSAVQSIGAPDLQDARDRAIRLLTTYLRSYLDHRISKYRQSQLDAVLQSMPPEFAMAVANGSIDPREAYEAILRFISNDSPST